MKDFIGYSIIFLISDITFKVTLKYVYVVGQIVHTEYIFGIFVHNCNTYVVKEVKVPLEELVVVFRIILETGLVFLFVLI